MTRRFGILACVATAILVAAAVVMGGLNQDEGWYLYAARLVGEGRMPYRDFFYTQGPLMPLVYSAFAWTWAAAGLVGARLLTAAVGLAGVGLAVALARRLVPAERRAAACVAVLLLLGCNIYHLYYLSIPKTYALAAFFVTGGYYLLHRGLDASRWRGALLFASGLSLAFAAGTRISLGALLAVVGFALLASFRRFGRGFVWFGLGGALGLALVYGPFVVDREAFAGLCAAQRYHAARGGFSPVFVVGSLSRLVRWYLPVWILLGLGIFALADRQPSAFAKATAGRPATNHEPSAFAKATADRPTTNHFPWMLFAGFLAVFAVQMLAPFPYEDYQVPVMGLAAVAAAALAFGGARCDAPKTLLLALGLAFATSFGSPLLESWTTDGQDRFWTLVKEKPEILRLRDAAREVESLDPGGSELLTQDLYLAVETGRRVPAGLEMGPFSIMTEDEWRTLLWTTDCPVAALSGYSFAVEPPECAERDPAVQREFREIVGRRYETKRVMPRFGQNATTLEIMKRRDLP